MIAKETLAALEFTRILEHITEFAHSPVTETAILGLTPSAHAEEITSRFGQVAEVRRLGDQGVPLPLAPFGDIRRQLELVRPQGAILSPMDLLPFLPVFRVLVGLSRQFAYRTDIPLLKARAGELTGFPDIGEPLSATLDDEGTILDSASRLLHEIRVRKRSLTARIRKRLEEIVRERSTAIFLQDEFITQRGGRWVIPVRMDSKGMVPGVVHDVSNSGETAFMEPLEIIGMANELENLSAEEKAEQIRILRQLSSWLRDEADAIETEFNSLVYLDVLNSIAGFSDLLEAENPVIGEPRTLRLVEARHPLLMLKRKSGGSPVVPLVLSLDAGMPAMVITGPNTGGKTIAIKTAGLLTLMALAGIPIPAASTTVIPLIDNLLVDIGDDQSIESSLSTFSAHIEKIAAILENADDRSLVLLDELGTGTEPGQGAAIACAVLHQLLRQKSLVLATTHLTDIIGFVHKTEGMTNAAMEFDRQTLTPLYRLRSGEPGQSHALDVAQRHGLPLEVVEFARGMVGRLDTEFHELLGELRELRRQTETALAEAEARRERVAAAERTVAERLAALESERREVKEKGLREARELVQGVRRDINLLLEEARRTRSRDAREKAAAMEKELEGALAALRPEEQVSPREVAVGDAVFVTTIGYDAVITSIDPRHDRLRVRAGQLEVDVPFSAVAPRRGKTLPSKQEARRPNRDEEVPGQLHLVGLRVEEALARLEPFLNHASLAALGELRIVHGKGTGALRRAVREYLDRHPLVAEVRSGENYEGGEGVTVVTLR